jgi:hypothetical protein
MPGSWRVFAFVAAVLALALPHSSTRASMPFNPVLDVFASSPAASANSNLRISTTLPAGNHALGTWSFFMPANWNISDDSTVFNGDVVARGTMSVDTDCDGSVQTYGPFDLVDVPVDPGPDHPVAQWSGQIAPWWNLPVTVDQITGEPFDISADLTNFSVFHALCAPQTFIVTVLGRSSPNNNVVLTNPSSAGNYVWTGSYASFGGEHIKNVNDSVCIGNTCDTDSDTVPNVTDNCPAWPNQPQNLPLWPVLANDPDCDGFSTFVEDPAGTNPLAQCGFNAWPADINNDTFVDVIGDISTVAGQFGSSVPPAPARYDIAPDPPDGFIDVIGDITKLATFFALTCAPCTSDFDCDSVLNASDNCPNWANPLQNLPPWPVPANDPDCDGFSTVVETSAGTNALAHCGASAWPADINSDGFVDVISDISTVGGQFGNSVPPAPARYDIAPDPPDHLVDVIGDITKLATLFALNCH